MKKLKYLFITCISYFLLVSSVSAQEILFFEVDPYYRGRMEGSTQFQELTILTINDGVAYSLESITMPTQVIYEKNNNQLSNFTKDDLSYLQKIAYFGYKKENPNKKMYMAAQELIWEYVNHTDVYWTDYNDSIVSVEEEKNKIIENINNMNKLPIFSTFKIKGNYFEDIALTDSEKVLEYFEVVNESRNIIEISENELRVKLKESSKLTLQRNFKTENSTNIYSAINSVDIITLGMDEAISVDLEIELIDNPTTYLEFKFLNDEKSIDGIVEFKIDNQLYKTDQNGHFLSKELFDVGEHKIGIIKVPEIYEISEKEFTINLLEENIDSKRTISFERNLNEKLGSFNLYRAGFIEEEQPLKDIEYELYAYENIYSNNELIYEKNQKILSSKTDEKGQLNIENLYIGKYYLKEITDSSFEKPTYDITFEITPNETYIYQKIMTNHKSLKIMIIGEEEYKYILYNKEGEMIKELTLKEENLLPIEYNNYYIKVLKNQKLLYTWDIDYNKEKDKYVFYTKDYMDFIDFDMPKTGKKSTSSLWIICILLILIKKIK